MLSPHIIIIILNQLNIKKIIPTKIILEKIIKNKNKNKKNHVGKHCSNPQCFKEKNYKVKFSFSSILKNKSTKIILKKMITKKTMWGNPVAIHNVLMKNNIKLNFNQLNIRKVK